MMIDSLLSRLSRVRAKGGDSWTARCPAHEDATPSLSVRIFPDGRILIHCFAGCSPSEVVEAAGIELADLMPERPVDRPGGPGGHSGVRPSPFTRDSIDVLASVAHESALACVGLEMYWRGAHLSSDDEDRIMEAYKRLRAFVE